MILFGFDTDFLIGPALISFEGTEIGFTLEDSDVKLTIKPITKEISTDEKTETAEIVQVGEEVKFSCAIPYTSDSIEWFSLSGESLELKRTGEMVINSPGLRVTLYKAVLTMSIEKPYAWDKPNRINLEVTALRNTQGKIYNIELID
jgi:hypothetical protein